MNKTLTEMAMELVKTKDFFKVYEFIDENNGFNQDGMINAEGQWILLEVIRLAMKYHFKLDVMLNPSYLGEIGFDFKLLEDKESVIEFLKEYEKSKKEWYELHKQYIGIDVKIY